MVTVPLQVVFYMVKDELHHRIGIGIFLYNFPGQCFYMAFFVNKSSKVFILCKALYYFRPGCGKLAIYLTGDGNSVQFKPNPTNMVAHGGNEIFFLQGRDRISMVMHFQTNDRQLSPGCAECLIAFFLFRMQIHVTTAIYPVIVPFWNRDVVLRMDGRDISLKIPGPEVENEIRFQTVFVFNDTSLFNIWKGKFLSGMVLVLPLCKLSIFIDFTGHHFTSFHEVGSSVHLLQRRFRTIIFIKRKLKIAIIITFLIYDLNSGMPFHDVYEIAACRADLKPASSYVKQNNSRCR